jgi:tetratricopeptide (TPR) repeat protein
VVLEKLPFLAFSAVSCLITIASNRAVGALVEASAVFPVELRLQNALFSYVKYLGKTLWPCNLAVFYPYPEEFPTWRAVLCGLLLLGISGWAIVTARSRPYLLVGWFWFLGVLVPFVGLLQAGEQAIADRFAYVPLIGLFLLLVWGAEELTRGWRKRRLVLTTVAVAVLFGCGAFSRRQTGYWQNSVTLFSHALAVTSDNARAHSNLGLALAVEGKTEESIQHLLEALRLNPEHAIAHWAVGSGRAGQGRFEEAIQHYETALSLKPDFPEALNDLAWIRAAHSDPNYRKGASAVELAERACRLTEQQEPLFIGTLAAAYAEAGRFEDAVRTAERAKDLAAAAGQKELVEKNQQLLVLYRAGKPYHETMNTER